jgi:hypothetical protein
VRYGQLTVEVRPGAEAWVPPARWFRFFGDALPGPQRVVFHPRSERARAWAEDHPERKEPPGHAYSFRAYTRGPVTRIFVDDTETRASTGWLLAHELAHALLNRVPSLATELRRHPRPERYATSDEAHEAVPEEQVANRVADLVSTRLGGRPGLNRRWWRARTPVQIGLSPEEHGDKLPAWTLRLRSALKARARAAARRDAGALRRAEEDIGFWTGRLTGELLASQGAPGVEAAQREAARALAEAAGLRLGYAMA